MRQGAGLSTIGLALPRPAKQRLGLHRRIGVRLEAGYGAQAKEIAAQLAVHFEPGGKIRWAVHYWQHVGDNAARRNAHYEAIAALRNSLSPCSTRTTGAWR